MTSLARWSDVAADDARGVVTRSINPIRRFARSWALVCINRDRGDTKSGLDD